MYSVQVRFIPGKRATCAIDKQMNRQTQARRISTEAPKQGMSHDSTSYISGVNEVTTYKRRG